jgi:DNA-directed RNA polymerase subunit RPC12/RpoP
MTAFACPHCGQRVGIPDGGQVGQRFQCPHCGKRISLAVRTQIKADPPAALPPDWIALDSTDTGEASAKATPGPLSALGAGSAAHGLVAPLAATKKRRSKSGRWLIPAGILAGVVVVLAVTVWDRSASRAARHVAERTKIAVDDASSGSAKTSGDGKKNTAAIVTSLRPIRLLLAPAGVRVAIHLRPARLWADSASSKSVRSARTDELRHCLAPLSTWTERQFTDYCLFHPSEIDEALFSFVLRSPDEPPEVAATVWLKQSTTESAIAQKFGGQKAEHAKLSTWLKGDRALVIRDGKTFAIGPQAMAQEMADANEQPNPTDESIEELLKQTDREQDLTIVFRPDDLDRFRETLVPQSLQAVGHDVARWLDPEATEGAVLSFELADPFRVRLALRSRSTQSVRRLEQEIQQNIEKLPTDILAEVEVLDPQTIGHRKLVGRVPAMWKAVALGTQETTQPRLVVFESILPERAAANLAIGTLIALSEPRSQSRSKSGRNRRPGTSDQQRTIAERLSTKIEVDFRRTPISEAFSSIGEDIGLTFEIDGGALKLAGYTKNMPQSIRLSGVPASQALRTILKPYAKMALVADESRQTITVTTVESATEKGQKPLVLQK